jgi:hypothetical protein
MRTLHCLLPRFNPQQIYEFVKARNLPDDFCVWPYKTDCRKYIRQDGYPVFPKPVILSNLGANNSEFCYLKGVVKILKENDIIIWSPT